MHTSAKSGVSIAGRGDLCLWFSASEPVMFVPDLAVAVGWYKQADIQVVLCPCDDPRNRK